MSFRDHAVGRPHPLFVVLLGACALLLVAENAVLLSLLLAWRQWSVLATLVGLLKVAAVLAVPMGIVLLTVFVGWRVAAQAGAATRAHAEVRHDRT